MRTATIVGLTFLLLSGMAHADFPAGEAAFQRQDFGAAAVLLKPDADAGNAQAQYLLGVMLRKGQGMVKDPAAAAVWFQRAAMQGHRDAISTLAALYRIGEGVPQDYQQALRWYREAAKLGFENAQYRIALMYNEGQGVAKDPVEAYKWAYTSAVQGGQPEPTRLRDKLAKQLSPAQIEQAQKEGNRFIAEVAQRLAAMEQQAVSPPTTAPAAGRPTAEQRDPITAPAIRQADRSGSAQPPAISPPPAAPPSSPPPADSPRSPPPPPVASSGGPSQQSSNPPKSAATDITSTPAYREHLEVQRCFVFFLMLANQTGDEKWKDLAKQAMIKSIFMRSMAPLPEFEEAKSIAMSKEIADDIGRNGESKLREYHDTCLRMVN